MEGKKIQRQVCDEHGEFESSFFELAGNSFWTTCPECSINVAKDDRNEFWEEFRKIRAEGKQNAVAKQLENAGVPIRFQDSTFADYEVTDEKQRRVLTVVQSYADNFAELRQRGVSMIFAGSSGTGKTHLACAIGNQIMEQGFTFAFVGMRHAIAQVRGTWGKGEMSEQDVIDRFVAPDLLVLDEIGVQFGTEAERIIMFELINSRYERMKPTILMTNLSADEDDEKGIRQFLGARIFDRIRQDGGRVLKFQWASHRGIA